jgi:L-seryl-tRNA(Ser) seleniumtransferase
MSQSNGWIPNSLNRLSRRQWFGWLGFVGGGALVSTRVESAGAAQVAAPPTKVGGLAIGPNIYQSIGVRSFINGTGTLTVNSGSLELPEVQQAQEWASKHMVQLDELMEAVGNRLAVITGAEYGIVTSGCAAAMTHATAACLTGGNPDKHVHLPSMDGLDKTEVIIPKAARNNYDAAIRATGVKIVEVNTLQELEAAINPKTAMIYIRSEVPNGPPANVDVYRVANARGIPVLVDAAPEVLTIPNVHLKAGATMVCYSGGKQLRGPQCAGLLLGRKDLLKAAWVTSAPHHGFSRSMKVGKEEIVGMLAAVEVWAQQDHKIRWQRLIDKLNVIGKKMSNIPGVTTTIRESAPEQLSNRNVTMAVNWDPKALNITGQEVARILDTTEPRVLVSGGGGGGGGRRGGGRGTAAPGGGPAGGAPPAAEATGISVSAFNLGPNEEKIVADRLHQILTARRAPAPPAAEPKPPMRDVSGEWDFEITFAAGTGMHRLTIKQDGASVQGTHQGDFLQRPLTGNVNGDTVTLRSNVPERTIGNSLSYTFTGKMEGGRMSGDLDMGEYLKGKWTARKRA